MRLKILGLFAITFAGYLNASAQSGFACGAVQEATQSTFANNQLKIDITLHCEKNVAAKSDFVSDKVAAGFLAYINGASQKKVVLEGAVPQNGYQKKYETYRVEAAGGDTLKISAVEEIVSYPELVIYKNDTTNIQGTGLAGQIKETHVVTQVSVKQRASGVWYVAFDTRSIGKIDKPFIVPVGVFKNIVLSTSKKELSSRSAVTLGEIAKSL